MSHVTCHGNQAADGWYLLKAGTQGIIMLILLFATHFNICSGGANGLNTSQPLPGQPAKQCQDSTMTPWWQLQLYPAVAWAALFIATSTPGIVKARIYSPWGMEMNEGSWEERWRKELLTIRGDKWWPAMPRLTAGPNRASVVVGICRGHNDSGAVRSYSSNFKEQTATDCLGCSLISFSSWCSHTVRPGHAVADEQLYINDCNLWWNESVRL